MKEMFFKATRRNSVSMPEYRQIVKRDEDNLDIARGADDYICIDTSEVNHLKIDCNRRTGEFRIFI